MKAIKTAMICILALTAVSVGAQPPQSRQGMQGRMQMPTPEQRAKESTERLTRELELTETQQQQVYNLLLANSKKSASLMENGVVDMEQIRTENEKKRETTNIEMKKILSEEQFAKWEKIQAERSIGTYKNEERNQKPEKTKKTAKRSTTKS